MEYLCSFELQKGIKMIRIRSLMIGLFCTLLICDVTIVSSSSKTVFSRSKSGKFETNVSEKTINRNVSKSQELNKPSLAEKGVYEQQAKQQILKSAKAKIAKARAAGDLQKITNKRIADNNAKIMTEPSIVPYVKELHTNYAAVPKDILLSATMQIIDIKNSAGVTKNAEVPQVIATENAGKRNVVADAKLGLYNLVAAPANWLTSAPPKVTEAKKISPQDIKNSSNMDWHIISNPSEVPLENVYKSLQVVNEIYSKTIVPITEVQVPYVQALQAKYPHVNKPLLVEYAREYLDAHNKKYTQKNEQFRDKKGILRTEQSNDVANPTEIELADMTKDLLDLPTTRRSDKKIVLVESKLSTLEKLYQTIKTVEAMNKKYFKAPQFAAQKRAVILSLGKDIAIQDPIAKTQATADALWENSYPIELVMAQLEKIAVMHTRKDIAEKIVGLEKQYALDLLSPDIKSQAVDNLVKGLKDINLEMPDSVMQQSVNKYVNVINQLTPRIIVLQDCVEALLTKSKNSLKIPRKTSLIYNIDFVKNLAHRKDGMAALEKEIGIDVSGVITKQEWPLFCSKLIEKLDAEKPFIKVGTKMQTAVRVGAPITFLAASVETVPAAVQSLKNSIESTLKTLSVTDYPLSPEFSGFINFIVTTSAFTLISLLGTNYLSKDEKKKAQGDLYQAVIDDVISVVAATTGASEQAIATANASNIAHSAAVNGFMSYVMPKDPANSTVSQDPLAYTKNIDRFRENLIQKQLEAMKNKETSTPIARSHATKPLKTSGSLNIARA